MTRLESAPGFTWGPRVPKCTALCAETLPPPPTHPTSYVFSGSGKPGGWRGEAVEIGQNPLPGRMKRKEKSPLVESVMPHCSAAHSLSVHICAPSGSTHPAERLLYHRPHSAFPTPRNLLSFLPSAGTDTLFTSPITSTSKQMFCGKVTKHLRHFF